jgi:large subunit ribosomal protein L29
MKAAELRQKDVAGLQTEVKELQKAHFGLRMQKATQQLNNTPSCARRAATSPAPRPSLLKRRAEAKPKE